MNTFTGRVFSIFTGGVAVESADGKIHRFYTPRTDNVRLCTRLLNIDDVAVFTGAPIRANHFYLDSFVKAVTKGGRNE